MQQAAAPFSVSCGHAAGPSLDTLAAMPRRSDVNFPHAKQVACVRRRAADVAARRQGTDNGGVNLGLQLAVSRAQV